MSNLLVKNKFRNPFEEKKPKKVGRLSQLTKANRRLRNIVLASLSGLESNWQADKRWGVVAYTQ